MYFPADMTADDIMEFEYDYTRWAEEVDGTGQYWAVNRLLQEIANEQEEV